MTLRDLGPVAQATTIAAICASNGACSSPTAPMSVQSLTITGATVLTPGLTTQLTVTSVGTSNPTAVRWQSKAPAVATISPSGLVTAVSPGAAVVTATVPGATGLAQIIVQQTNTATSTITGCRSLAMPGQYVVGADVPLTTLPCITVSNVASVGIDCAGHTMPSVSIRNASAVTIRNCTITDAASPSGYSAPLDITGANGVTVDRCLVTSASPIGIQVISGSNVSFTQDMVATMATGTSASIAFVGGVNNRVINSTLTGGYDSGEDQSGTDDGIVVENESGDTFQGNTIRQMFDMGIEGASAEDSTLIADNTFADIGIAGVGSYWCSDWTNNTIRHNIVSQTPTLVFVDYQVGDLCGPTKLPATLTSNQFVGNVFSSPAQGGFTGLFARPRMYVSMSGTVSGNVVQGNDFGTNECPSLTPSSGFIDGGGNICSPIQSAGFPYVRELTAHR